MTILQVFRMDRELSIVLFHRMVLFQVTVTLLLMTTLLSIFLRRITPTSPGLDALPSWLFSKCSYELAGIIAYIFDYSFSNGVVPGQWKRSVITPVPKVSRPMSISQFRPISVTPILSRLAEKLVVRNWLFPAIDSTFIADQFAFKPTGSTTCALTFFIHHVTRLIEDNSYVRCLLIDFSKAFDVVDHGIAYWFLSFLGLTSHPVYFTGFLASLLVEPSRLSMQLNCRPSSL